MGRSITYALAAREAEIVCHGGQDRNRLREMVNYIQANGGSASGVFMPFSNADEVPALIERVGEVDVLVVAFGPIVYETLARTTTAQWRSMVELNLLVPGILLSYYLPRMVERGWGRIVLFCGPHGDTVRGFQHIGAYSAAKAGVASLCRSAALQTHGQNVTVNAVALGYVETEYMSEKAKSHARERSPRRALISPERVARLVDYLVMAEEPDVNGAVIPMDQGLV